MVFQLVISGLYLTGGVSFYQSNINAKNLIAMNNKSGDDLVNIIKSNLKFQIYI